MRPIKSAASGILGILLVTSALGAPFQAVPNLVCYYSFEEPAGPTHADSSGNNLTATEVGGVTIGSPGGPIPTGNLHCITLPIAAATGGTGGFLGSGAYLSTPSTPAISFTGPFTAIAWIKPVAFVTGNNPNDTGAFIFKWDYVNPPGVFRGYGVDIRVDGRIEFYTGTALTMDTFDSTGTAPPGVWTMVAAVFDGANKLIYLNGVLDSTKASALAPEASAAALQIGKDDYWRNFYGSVDEVMLFNRALTAAEIALLHSGLTAPTGLTATAGTNSVMLTWTAVTGATSYKVLRSVTNGGPYVTIASGVVATNFTDSTAMFPNTYYYVVQAVAGGVSSPNSNQASASPIAPIPRTAKLGNDSGRCGCASTSLSEYPVLLAALAALVLLMVCRR